MAESESGQDNTEEPTEKRRREAREKGQLPRSRELNTLAILMAGAGGLLIYGADLAGALLRLMRSNFELSRETAIASGWSSRGFPWLASPAWKPWSPASTSRSIR